MHTTWRQALPALAFLAVLTSALPVNAQELDPAFRADILTLMEVTGTARMGEQMAVLISTQVLEGFKDSSPDVSPRAFELVQEVLLAEFSAAFRAQDGLLTRMVPVYARHFNHEEVRGLLAFYETDLGRKTISVMPTLMQEGAELGQAWAAEIMPRVQETLQARLRAEGLVR